MKHYVKIDGSWYIFFKYYATISYFKQKNKDIELGDPTTNKEFLEDFKTSFLETIKGLGEALNIDNPTVIVGKDCKRQNIWRMKLFLIIGRAQIPERLTALILFYPLKSSAKSRIQCKFKLHLIMELTLLI